jgi:hypothetical protein
MNVTVNQIRKEMTTLVQAHDMVNSFFWGDFHRAYNEKTQLYPLVCSYLSDGAINTNMTQMQLVVIVCDKTFKGFENLNDTESDTVTVARHLYNVIRQSPRWNALLRVNSATLSKFYENTSDEVAGVILTMNVDIKQSRSLCGLPLDNYDFDGQFVGNECEPVLIVNSNQSFSFNAPSGTIVELPDTPVLVTDQDGNELANENLPSVTGGTIQVETGGVCLPANYVVEYADGTPIESGEIPSGESATVVVPNCEPCEDATYQLTLDGEPLEGGSGSIPSGENANIPIDEFIPECDPAIVTWDGDTDFPIATLECGDTLDVDCETLINGVVVEVEGDEFFIGFFRVVGGFPVYTLEDVGAVSYSINRWTINLAGVSIIEANTGTEEFPWLATWGEGVTVRQATISDACCDCEPTPCEDATVQINGEEVATVASGGMVNIAVENESGTPLGAFNEETGVWVVPDCPPCDPVEISVNGDLEVTAAAGTSSNITTIDQNSAPVVPMAVNVSGNDIEIQVNVPEPSGIAYFEPNDMAHPLPSFSIGDDGWRMANGVFLKSKPAYPAVFQTLDRTAVNPYATLAVDNIHGNRERFTFLDGTIYTPTLNVPFEDHLTGRVWIIKFTASNLWNNLLTLFIPEGYYLPSNYEVATLKTQSAQPLQANGSLHTTGQAQSTGTTALNNTSQFIAIQTNTNNLNLLALDKATPRTTAMYVKLM